MPIQLSDCLNCEVEGGARHSNLSCMQVKRMAVKRRGPIQFG
jgi:hypothetical protein